jgi:hypothetical protein
LRAPIPRQPVRRYSPSPSPSPLRWPQTPLRESTPPVPDRSPRRPPP